MQDAMAAAEAKIRATCKVAGTLAFKHEMERRVHAGVQFFNVHSHPFLLTGLVRLRRLAMPR